MVEHNFEVKRYIDYYLSLAVAPGYAILLNGKWGAGKTTFISSIKEDLDEKKVKYIREPLRLGSCHGD